MSSDIFDIRYIKLHFTIQMASDCLLPVSKASALRGGMGEMLLRANCIQDRNCEICSFRSECQVQRIMYAKYQLRPVFATEGESNGYVLACENYQERFEAGECLTFQLTLFGNSIVYFNQILNAFYALGQQGVGKECARFTIVSVTNTREVPILKGRDVLMKNFQVENLHEYIDFRMKQLSSQELQNRIVFRSPWTQKMDGVFLEEFRMDAIIRSIQRRIYLLDCFEGIDGSKAYQQHIPAPEIISQTVRPIRVLRYSFRHDKKMTLRGIKGEIQLSPISESFLPLLLAGERVHIGKNTSFGFGRYVLK